MEAIYIFFKFEKCYSLLLRIASQMTWIEVLLKILEETLLQPLYFCLGDSITDIAKTRNKVKTGIVICAIVYSLFSATLSGLTGHLVDWMGQNSTLHQDTVTYIRIELAGIVFGSLAKFLMLVIVMLEWNSRIYIVLTSQMISMVVFDASLASSFGLDLGALGIAISTLSANLVVFIVSLILVCKNLDVRVSLRFCNDNECDYAWIKSWTKLGLFSGLESLVRNSVYLVVMLRSINIFEEQGSYWITNTFIWSWLLLPILPLSELLKQDVSSSMDQPDKQHKHWVKILPYMIIGATTLGLWALTFPGWIWLLEKVLKADKAKLVLDLIQILVPCYAIFVFGLVIQGVFYGLGRMDILAFKSIIGNIGLIICFVMFKNGVLFHNNIFGLVALFGSILVLGSLLTGIMYFYVVRSNPKF